nr:hypothetical protein [Candidatus Sigynarchaeum springense]
MIARTKRIGLALGMLFSCSILAQALVGFTGKELAGSMAAPGSTSFNDKTTGGTVEVSDTKISKNWEAVETLTTWWDVAWDSRKKVTFTEPGLMDRDREPTTINMTFTGDEARVNSIRLTYFRNDSTWVEVPSQIYEAITHLNGSSIAFYTSCSIFFFLNITKGDTEIYYVYYDAVINTVPAYADLIDVRGRATAAITDDTVNPSFTHLNGTVYNNVDSLQIAVNNNWGTPQAAVCLVDTMRSGSDWGGPACSIYSARYGSTDTLNIGQRVAMSVGEMALQASSAADPFSTAERINVGPDNPREAWDGQGAIRVLDDGPLFTRIQIQTTDGAYAALAAAGSTSTTGWYRDSIWGTVSDSVNRGTTGGNGYVKYNITYTFYYYGLQTFAKINLDILAAPQRGPIGSGYPVERSNYLRPTNVNFKNYGDWPHLMQIVDGNAGTTTPLDRKAWLGSKYSPDGVTVYNMPIADRRRDYPLQPWTAWYASTGTTNPTIGMMAVTNSIGWEVTSLAVTGIGYNSLLQQILPEGHQGDIFTLQRGSTLKYEYYMLTAAGGTNWTAVQDMCRRMNDRVAVAISPAELFSQNSMFIHTDDLNGNLLLGTRVRLYDSVNALVRDEYVDSNGNVTFLGLVDGLYTVRVSFYTPNLLNEYVVQSETLTLDHLIPAQRIVFRDYNCNVAGLAFNVVNWARDNEKLTGVLIRIRNVTTNAIVEQNFTWAGFVDFRLFTTGATQYNLEFVYGGLARTANVTSPYTLAGNTVLNVGLAIETTAITITAQNASITLGQTYQIAFYYHLSGNTTARYQPSSVTVSTQFGSDYWTQGVDFTWSVSAGSLVTLNLLSGAGTRLVNSGLFSAYVHAANSSVETATEKVFLVVNPIGSSIKLTLNNTSTSQIQVSRGEQILLEIDYIDAQTLGDILSATVNYTLNATTTAVSYNGGYGNYSATIDTSTLLFGTYVVSVQAWRQNYEKAITSFVIIVYARPASLALSSQGNSFFGENFTIDVDLTDGINASSINSLPSRFDANIKGTSIWGTVLGSNGQYTAAFDGSDFTSLGIYTVQINWTAPDSIPYYQSVKSSIIIRIVERDSIVTYDPVGNVAFRETVQVNLRFEDGLNGTGISSHTTIASNVTGASLQDLGSGNYRASFNTLDLGNSIGTYHANISLVYDPGFAPYYESHWVNVKVVVVNRPTQLIADTPAAVEYGLIATFSIYYTDLLNGSRLHGDGRVSITSSNTTINAVLNVDKYDVSVNSSGFVAPGSYYVPITATWIGGSPYYTNNSVLVKVTVVQRSSQVSYDSLAPTPFGNNFTFFVEFKDGINGNPISGATISANLTNPTHITWSMGLPGRYSISFNTTEISANLGDHFLLVTVTAPGGAPYYTNGQIIIRLTTTDRPTVLSYSGLQPTSLNVDVVFTITFRDAQFGTGIFTGVSVTSPTANISLTPAPVNQMNGNYLITVHDDGLLTVGSHVVTFNFDAPASAPYYRDNSISVTINITSRATQIVYSGLVPTPYREMFDFTVQVQDALIGTPLSGLGGGVFAWNVSYIYVGETAGSYRFQISTTEHGAVGSVKYRIDATLSGNYSSSYAIIPFTIVNRTVSLSQGSLLPVSFGENVVFDITYADGINSTGLAGHASYLTTVPAFSSRQDLGLGVYRFTIDASNFAALGSYSIQVNALWPAAVAPFYAPASITVPVSIVPRGAGLTADKESNVQFGENITINISFQDTVNSTYINLPLGQLLVSVVGFANVTIVKIGAAGIYQAKISTLQLPAAATYTVSVSTVWIGTPFYYNVSRTVSVVVSQRNAMLYPGGEIYQPRGYNVLFNVSLYYIDVINGSTINQVTSVLRFVSAKDHLGINIPTVNATGTIIGYSASTGWYATFNSSHFVNPSNYAYIVTIQFNWSASAKPFYLNRVITFNITVEEARTQVIVVAGSFVAPSGQNHTLTFQYVNSESGQAIAGATVEVNGTQSPIMYGVSLIWDGNIVPSGVNYTISFNVTALPGGLHLFNITFSLTNFNTVTYVFTLVDTALASELVTDSIQSNRILGQSVSIVLAYRYQGSTNPITNAVLNVSSNVTSIFWAPAEYSVSYNSGTGKYNLTILNTGESALRINTAGFHQIYVTMYSNTTESRTINVQFEMLQIPTNITRVYFNGTRFVNSLPSYSTQITKSVNVTIDFVRLFPTAANITSDATVFMTSSSLSSNQFFSLSGTQYRLVLPAAALGVGTHFLFIIGQRADHQQSTKSIQIIVNQVSTNLTLFLNGTSNSSIQVKYGQIVNVSALYRNTVDNVFITDLATTVTMTGGSGGTTSWNLTVGGSYWRYLLDSRILGPPASYTMTLSASRANFTTSSKVFTIQVVDIPTTMTSLNSSSLSVIWSANFRVYVEYRDYLSQVVTAATVTSSPVANTTGGFDGARYWLGYNASAFGAPNIYNLIVTATRANRTSQSLPFSIDVRSIPTSIASYNGSIPSTDFTVYWGDEVDVIVRYRDIMHATAIAGATISAGTKNSSITQVSYASGEYTLRFNSIMLGTPEVYIISLTFSKANYELRATAITIQVLSPQTQLIVTNMTGSPKSSFNLVYGQSLSFIIRMRDITHGTDLDTWTINANPVASSSSFSFPNWTLVYNGLTPGIYTISLQGQKVNYAIASTLVTVSVDQIGTQLRTFAFNGGMQSAFSVQWGSTISITVQYQASSNGSVIDPRPSVVSTTSSDKLVGVPVVNAQNTTFEFDGSKFTQGVYTIIFEATKVNFDDATASITLTVNTMDTTLTIINVTSQVPMLIYTATWGTSVSFDVSYNQTATLNAFATIAGVVSASPTPASSVNSPVAGLRRLTYDTSLFSPGIHSITVTAAYQNRTARSAIVSLTIIAVSTRISAFTSLNVNTTSFDVIWGENLLIDVVYQAGTTNLTQLAGTSITSSPLTAISQANTVHDRVRLTFSTSSLATQIYQVTISASRANFSIASISVLINVQQRPTGANIYEAGGGEQYSFSAYWGDTLVVDVLYRDNLTTSSISNAAGTSITSTPAYTSSVANGLYRRLTFSTVGLSTDLYSIIISCNRANYTTSQRVILLNVLDVPTQVTTYNATTSLSSTGFKAEWNTQFQIVVQYNRTYLPAGIAGATVVASVSPLAPPTYLGNGRYLFTFNSSLIGSPNIYSITFTASLANFTTSAASVTLEVLRVSAVLQSYVQGGGLQSQFTIEWGKILTFTACYHLAASPFTGLHPTSVTPSGFPPGGITLGNAGNGENITMSVNASWFGGTGIFTSTFIMSRTNYTESSMLVTIQVVALETRVNLLMNSTSAPVLANITTSRQFYVLFENDITIRVQYLTQASSAPISGARVMIRFIELGINWTNYPSGSNLIENRTDGNYDLTLNTLSDLGDFGQYSFVVVISKQNYTLESEPFYVYPIKLQTRLDIFSSTWVNVTSGQKFTINYTQALVLYAALYDLSKSRYINTTYGVNYSATMKGNTYYPVQIYANGTGRFVFNTAAIEVDVGTSNFISLSGFAGIYNPAGESVNLEVKTVPTALAVYDSLGAPVAPGSTLQLNYTQSFRLNVTFLDTLNGVFLDFPPGVRVYAKVYAQEINATYVGNDRWEILFDSLTMPITTGSIPQITIYGTYQNYTTATFLFNLWVKEISTAISAYYDQSGIGGNVTLITASISVNWSEWVVLNVYYNSTLGTPTPITTGTVQATFGISPVYVVNATFIPLTQYYQISFDSRLLRGGNTHTIIITANALNYVGAEFRFNLAVLEVPTTLYVQNETSYITAGDTLQVYWGDTLRLNVTYQNLITGQNISMNGPTIRAVVLGTTIPAVNIGGGLWSIEINTSTIGGIFAGSTPQVLVSASWINYSQAAFSFNMQVLDLPTELIVPASFLNVTQYIWGQSFSIAVKYNDTHNDALINGTLVANYPAASSTFNGTDYVLAFNTTLIGPPGIYRITLTASKLNYAAASFTITVQILEVPTTMTVLFNGLPFLAIPLKEVVTITVNYSRTIGGLPVQNAQVTVTYTNDKTGTTLNRTLSFVGGVYQTAITLDLNTFYAEPKFFIVQAYRANYTIGRAAPVMQIDPVVVLPRQNQTPDNPMQVTITNVDPLTTLRFDFQLLDNSTGLGIIDVIAYALVVNISSRDLKIYDDRMIYVGNGTWRYSIAIPEGFGLKYKISISVYFADPEIKRQFDIQNGYEYEIYTKTYQGSTIPEWVFYLILVALVVVVVYFVLYQVRFKYPPIIRKIHDLSGAVRRGKPAAKIPVQKVVSREEGIYSEFAKLLNEYSFLQTQSKSIAALAKKTKQKGYVPPEAKDTLAKDFELTVKEKIVEVKPVAPAIFPKEGPKKITVGPPKAEYIEPEKPAAAVAPPKPAAPGAITPPATPGMPGMPSVPKIPAPGAAPGIAKPISISELPKPAAKPLPAKPGAIATAGEGQEGLYGELVKMEQKKYKAQRSLRDLKAKKEKGILTDEEYEQYRVKFEEALDKINEKIGEIRRKLVNF